MMVSWPESPDGASGPRGGDVGQPKDERVVYRDEFRARMGRPGKPLSSETVRVWIRDKRIPEPDVTVTLQTRGWKASTLRAAGLPF
jgi:hypothetical protein